MIFRNYGTHLRTSPGGGCYEVPDEPIQPDYYAPSPIPCRSWNSISPDWEDSVGCKVVWLDGRLTFVRKDGP